jgi:hypothetical protein
MWLMKTRILIGNRIYLFHFKLQQITITENNFSHRFAIEIEFLQDQLDNSTCTWIPLGPTTWLFLDMEVTSSGTGSN